MTFKEAQLQMPQTDAQGYRAELAAGLAAQQATIAPKFLYDALGSTLFEAICLLDEYDLTRTETGIIETNLNGIARAIAPGAAFIDLGAGNCVKAAKLLPALRPAAYVAVDISAEFLHRALAKLQACFPAIPMTWMNIDFTRDFDLPDNIPSGHRVFFYPGSSIGNFTTQEAQVFLSRLHQKADGLLIGVDLLKPASALEAAYDDALGVTAAFNINILRRVNRDLGADFDLRSWRHIALFNAPLSRVEMHLEARTAQTVHWPGGDRHFAKGERIHTENSYKYTPSDFFALLARSGFHPANTWTDREHKFLVCYARAFKDHAHE
jgi:dimethylhistidine N-methyltransferase